MVDSSPLRILIVRLSAIGDVLHGVPVLNALRDHHPNAHISWVVEGRGGDLIQGHPSLDQLVRIPRGWMKNPLRVWEVYNRLRQPVPDVTIDLQGLARSAIVAWLSGGKTRVGFAGPDGREKSRWLNNTLVKPDKTHVIDRNLQLLRPLGVENPTVRFDLPSYGEEAAAIQRYLQREGPVQPFAVVNPGAGWPSKLWEMDRFGKVAAYLGQQYGMQSLVVWAGEEEKQMAEEIVAHSERKAALSPQTTLRELAELLRQASLFISADTGPLHLAAAVGTPCIGLFGPVPAERNGPYGGSQVAVQRMVQTGPRRKSKNADNEAMRAIQVDDVITACDRILGRNKRRSA